jgi:hypothetical protein
MILPENEKNDARMTFPFKPTMNKKIWIRN